MERSVKIYVGSAQSNGLLGWAAILVLSEKQKRDIRWTISGYEPLVSSHLSKLDMYLHGLDYVLNYGTLCSYNPHDKVTMIVQSAEVAKLMSPSAINNSSLIAQLNEDILSHKIVCRTSSSVKEQNILNESEKLAVASCKFWGQMKL